MMTSVCPRRACILDAMAWVERGTGERAVWAGPEQEYSSDAPKDIPDRQAAPAAECTALTPERLQRLRDNLSWHPDPFNPAPVESLNYVPASNASAQHVIADGPYKVASYTPTRTIAFVRNPASLFFTLIFPLMVARRSPPHAKPGAAEHSES